MKTIIARTSFHLQRIIAKEIAQHGPNCDLNHIDISNVPCLNHLFYRSQFNGDISKWNVGNVWQMSGMFYNSKFSGDISNWNVDKVNRYGFHIS